MLTNLPGLASRAKGGICRRRDAGSSIDAAPLTFMTSGVDAVAGNAANHQSGTFRSRRALAITETEENVMATLASIGLRRGPPKGYRMPAAMGMPRML